MRAMSKRWMILMGAAMFSLLACQSKKEALELACDSPNHVDNSLPPTERGQALAAYIEQHVTNDEVLGVLAAEEPRQQKAKLLESLASSEGVAPCGLAKLWATPPLPPRPVMPSTSALLHPPMPRASGSASPPAQVTVLGDLSVEQVSAVVNKTKGPVAECYKAGLRRNKDLAGRIDVRFVVGVDGKVKEVREQGSAFPDADVVDCVVRSFEKLAFPKPQMGDVVVVYPLVLRVGS